MLGSNLALIVGLVALAWVPQVARVARGVTADIVHREYVAGGRGDRPAARRRILVREVLPNVATPLMVEYGLRLTWSIAVIAAISFLGFGIQPPNADWGLMINENRNGITLQPWAVVAPARLHRDLRDRHELRHRGHLAGGRRRRRRGRRVSAVSVAGLRVELTRTGGEIVDDDRPRARARRDRSGSSGESGSGKTTVAVALLGHAKRGTRIARGSVRIGGARRARRSAPRPCAARGASSSRTCRRIPASALNPRSASARNSRRC